MKDGGLGQRMKKRTKYEKPLFEKQDGMDFPKQIIEKINAGRFCLQCSGCHGCR